MQPTKRKRVDIDGSALFQIGTQDNELFQWPRTPAVRALDAAMEYWEKSRTKGMANNAHTA